MIRNNTLARLLFQGFSVAVAGFVLLTIFAVYTAEVGGSFVLPTVATLGSVVVLRYVAVYHPFSRPISRRLLVSVAAVVTVAVGGFTLVSFADAITVRQLLRVFDGSPIGVGTDRFLPDWWVAVILVPAGVLVAAGAVQSLEFDPYPSPSGIRETARSPVYFGLVCAFFGLWAVAFVGISIQRVVVIAPVFEELLKFGIALLVGSALFGRSLAARIGVAVVVGSLFGLVEHATTYPNEADSVYLFRTLFHMMTTVLSVTLYTSFESRDELRLQWISPVLSMFVHFFYNTFVVLSSIVSVFALGGQSTTLSLVYGGVAIVATTTLFALALVRHRTIRKIYVPLEHVLSDLV